MPLEARFAQLFTILTCLLVWSKAIIIDMGQGTFGGALALVYLIGATLITILVVCKVTKSIITGK